jgi:hypothetical protein
MIVDAASFMSGPYLVRIAVSLIGASLFLRTAEAEPPSEPWATRGAEVESAYKSYGQRLEGFYASFTSRLKEDAPDLIPSLKIEAPTPVAHGYQILPDLLPNGAPPAQLPRAEVHAYSWPWTRTKIEREAEKLDALEADFARARTAAASERRALYEKILTGYKPLPDERALIDAHIEYNRLWQNNIAANRAFYDRQTRLEGAVVERQSIRDALAASDEAAFRQALAKLPAARTCDSGKTRGQCEELLRSREEPLSLEIHDATDEVAPPAFVRVERPTPHRWIVRVPFITDIADRKFLRSFRSAVEETWRVTDGEDDYRVEVSFKRISPRRLYERSAAPPPKAGDAIDLAKHLALFPPGYAVLTTGATTTHVELPRAIVIGSNEIGPHDLAHEFGHILGFKDVYFRGYRDLGGDGFEVQEVIAEPGDIMGAPGWGPVRKGHFTRLIEALAR